MSTATVTARPQRQGRPKPAYILRAKVGNGWTNIGAMWALRSGEDGYSMKMTTVPLNWDGRFIALRQLENEQVPEEPPQE